jgi:hypothetical protein
MFLWYPVMELARAPRRTARKKGSGYENGITAAGLEFGKNKGKASLALNVTKVFRIFRIGVYGKVFSLFCETSFGTSGLELNEFNQHK